MVRYIPPIGGGFESKVKAYRSTSYSFSSGVTLKVALDAKLFDVLGEFDSANSRFVAKENGYYFVAAQVSFYLISAAGRFITYIMKNGSTYTYTEQYCGGVNSNPSILTCDIVYLDAGNYIEVYAFQNTGAAQTLRGGSMCTFLSIHRLS
jgi:hypothetical protein